MLTFINPFLDVIKRPNVLVFFLIWIFISIETHLWWQTQYHTAAVITALIGYSMLLYGLLIVSNNLDTRPE